MTELYLADALQEVSPEHIMEACLPLRKQKRIHWGALAACFVLVAVGTFFMEQIGFMDNMEFAGGSAVEESEGSAELNSEMESISDGAFGQQESTAEGENPQNILVYDAKGYGSSLISGDLEEMYRRSDTVVLGHYSGEYGLSYDEDTEIRSYDFIVSETLKGDAAGVIRVRLASTRLARGSAEGENYALTVPVATFQIPQAGEHVLLFLTAIEGDLYRKAQEPFTIAILPDDTVELRSNLLLTADERKMMSTTVGETERGAPLTYQDATLLTKDAELLAEETISGRHINDILEELGADFRWTEGN